MRPDAKAKIDELCRAWAEDTGEPLVTLVARHGVVVTHEAFGRMPNGEPATRDYRCWVASITKTVTALLFSQFLDQGLIALDDPLSAVFPDYSKNDPHVPTFRQCFNHTSGLSGDFGGMRNPDGQGFAAFGRFGILGAQLRTVGIELPFTWVAVIMAQSFVALPFFVRQASAGFASIDAHLMGVSRTLGAGSARTFFRVAIPLARQSLSAGAALSWARALGEFGATALFAGSLQGTTQTLPLAIYDQFSAADLDAALAMSALMVAFSAGILAAVKVITRSSSW